MRQFNFFNPQEAALLRERPKFRWNPLPWVWTCWEHTAYFFAPPNGCVYCWLLRLYVIGIATGAAAVHWWPK